MVDQIAYRVEAFRPDGLCAARYERVPLLEIIRTAPDRPDIARGLLPPDVEQLAPGYRVRVAMAGRRIIDAPVVGTAPQWSDARKRLVDRYVSMHRVTAFDAAIPALGLNDVVAGAFRHREATSLLRDLVQAAPNRLHAYVDHTAYPEGAEREWAKFLARQNAADALPVGGVDSGSWVGPDRIDASAAHARDGRTIAGLRVDGGAWPDLRLLGVDCEEVALNGEATARHPDTVGWSAARYAASGYAVRAEASRETLQALIDTKGVSHIELDSYRDQTGGFANRIDADGRYVGLAFGGGACFNAALIELGQAGVALPGHGRRLAPALALKDFFSYAGPHRESIEARPETIARFDAEGGALELATALAYMAGGSIWSLDDEGGIRLRRPGAPDHVVVRDPVVCGVTFGEDLVAAANRIAFAGGPDGERLASVYTREASVRAVGVQERGLVYRALSQADDADLLVEALLDDVAYPRISAEITFYRGRTDISVGDLVEVRGAELRRVAPPVDGLWGGRYADRLVGRVDEVRHLIAGRRVSTTVRLTSPLRSVADPIAFMTRSQPSARTVRQFRLDDDAVGLDGAHHLD